MKTTKDSEIKQKMLVEKKESTYVKGLPFTLDFKKMFEKTIASRFKEGDQDVIESTKLGIENSKSFVDIKENKRYFSVEFDGQGVSSEEDLIKLMLSLYSEKSENSGKLNRLGTAITAALSKKPLEILVETHHNGDGICMVVDSNFKPQIYRPEHNIKNNKITVIKKKTDFKLVAANALKVLTWPMLKIRNKKNDLDIRLEKIVNIAEYTDKKVTYNNKKCNRGFKFKDTLFQKEYTIGDSRLVLAIPLKNYGGSKKTIYLKDEIPIHEDISSFWEKGENRFSNWLNWNKFSLNNYTITPNILVSNPGLKSTMSDRIVSNYVLKKITEQIKEAKSKFYMDFLKGKFDDSSVKRWSSEDIGRRNFLKALFFTKIKEKYIKVDTIKEYAKNKDGLLSKLSDDEAQELKRFFSVKIFKDVDNKTFSIPEMYKFIEKNSNLVYYTSRGSISRNHPAFKGKIEQNRGILFFETSGQRELFEEIFPSKIAYRYNEKETSEEGDLEKEVVLLKDVNYIVDDYKRKMREKMERKIQAVKKTGIKTAKIVGGTTAGSGVIVGGYHAFPHLASALGSMWGVCGSVAEFLFVTNPEISIGTGITGATVYATYKAAPHINKGLGHISRGGGFLVRKSMNSIGASCRFIGRRCSLLEQSLENVNYFTSKKTQRISNTVGKVWHGFTKYAVKKPINGFTKYAIKKPIKSTLGFIGRKLQDADNYLEERARKAKEVKKNKIEKNKRKQEEVLKNLEKMREKERGKYCWKFGKKIKKDKEIYLDYLIGSIQKGIIKSSQHIFSEIGGVEILESYRRKPFNLRYQKDAYWLQINVSSNVLENKVDAFYKSGGRTLFADLEEIGSIVGKGLLRETDSKARLENLYEETINKLYCIELEDILKKYKSSDKNFDNVFESLGRQDKKYILKRIIENNPNGEKSSLEEWLVDNYNSLLEEVSEEIISQRAINLLKKSINKKETHESIQLFEELTPNEKIKFVNEDYSPAGVEKSENFLDAHINEGHPFLKLNSLLQQKYEKSSDDLPSFKYEDDARILVSCYGNGRDYDSSGFEYILWSEKKTSVAPWKRGSEMIFMKDYNFLGVLSDTKRAMQICLGAFYMLPEEKRKPFLKKIKEEQSKNPYYLYFVEAINQHQPKYKEIFSKSNIVI